MLTKHEWRLLKASLDNTEAFIDFSSMTAENKDVKRTQLDSLRTKLGPLLEEPA